MAQALKRHWIALACAAFVLANAALTAADFPWLALLPIGMLAAWAIVVKPEQLLLFIAFATPLSINLEELAIGGIGVALPTEPLMVGLAFLLLLRLALQRGVLDAGFLKHPVTQVVVAQLVWMTVCILPSSMPVVSVKHVIARLWFVSTMYLLASVLFRDERQMHRFIKAFVGGLAIVVAYTLVQHSEYRFAHEPAHWVMSPFFKDHTSYGAVIAFVLPFTLAAIGMPGYSRTERGLAFVLLLLLIAIDRAAVQDGPQGSARFMGIDAGLVMGGLAFVWLAAGLVAIRDALVYALFAAMVLTLALSWGRNLMPLTDFFLDHVPGYSKFRAVTIILVVVELAVPVLGMLWLDRMLREGAWDRRQQRRFLIAAGGVATLLAAIALFPGAFSLLSDAERARFNARIEADPAAGAEVMALVDGIRGYRAGVLSADAWRSFGFVVAGGAVLWMLGRRRLGAGLGIAALGLLMLADQWAVDKRYVNNAKEKGRYLAWEDEKAHLQPHKPTAADLAILQMEWNPKAEAFHREAMERMKRSRAGERGSARHVTKEDEQLARFASLRRATDYRVLWLGNPFNDARVSYFHKSVGGYHGAKLKRYQELIEFHLRPAILRIGGLFGPGATMERLDSALAREGVLNMLNTRHLIYSNDRPPLLNANALGSAWFVDELRWVRSADEEIMALDGIDPARVALADERFRTELGDDPLVADPSASAVLDGYATNRLEYTVRSEK
ncbi:MAG: hypothetical protein ACK4L7_05450, partial [Flavobacteriales bacterium]